MSNEADVLGRLNIRDGMEVREHGSLDEAVLWCYRHDFHPIGAWPEGLKDPDFDVKVGFALPHLEDYLRLILKDAGSVDIPAYAQSLYPRMIAETEKFDRYPNGDLRTEGVVAALVRFASADFDKTLRDHDVSIYPFRAFEVDFDDLLERVPDLHDERTHYLADMFRSYFPTICNGAENVRYSSHDDPIYLLHSQSINNPLQWFMFSNPSVPEDKFKWRPVLDTWRTWAAMLLRPRIEGEEF